MNAQLDAVATLRAAGLLHATNVRTEELHGASVGVLVRVTVADGDSWVVKTVPGVPAEVLDVEAAGLSALGATGAVAVPVIHHEQPGALVLESLHPVPSGDPCYWQLLAEGLAEMHRLTRQDRHGWPVDNWLGLLPQINTWDTDGHRFFAEHRVRRFLREPPLRQALSARDRAAVELLADRLPELVPPMPAVLLHGDLWQGNLVADPAGRPVLIDPAVHYGWAEVDIGMLWLLPRPDGSDRFFDVWQELADPVPGWRERAKLLIIRELLSIVAQHGEHDGTADQLRALVAPFRRRTAAG